MVTSFHPFTVASLDDKYYRLLASEQISSYWSHFEINGLPRLSEELKDLLNGMLTFDPQARLTIEEIRAHPWMR